MHTVTTILPNTLAAKLEGFIDDANAEVEAAERDFCSRYPDYEQTRDLDALRCNGYARLDDLGHTYLDYTGGGLFSTDQLEQHTALLTQNIYGNPHSLNPTSLAATEINESARHAVLDYFHADPDQYTVIFTMNASGALKLVGEAYPFDENSHYLLLFDNHNSVNGIREYARNKGAKFTYSPLLPGTLRLDEAALMRNLDAANGASHKLFAFPAQSNFSGVKHPLRLIEEAQSRGWDVMLDAAAFLPTNQIDLHEHQPEFVSMSFYKMFGYPTGIGALVARKDALEKLKRPWFAGGTISIATVQADAYYLHVNEAGFEDGTINYLGIPAVEIGLKHLQKVGVPCIQQRVTLLTAYLLDFMKQLKHSNGQPVINIYGPTDTDNRGATIAFNVYDPNGHVFEYQIVETAANSQKISLRTGCFCNPGAGESAHGLTAEDLQPCFINDRMDFTEMAERLVEKHSTDIVGAIRASLGIATNFADAYRLTAFLKLFIDEEAPQR
ncbi:MAG: aminotransferase class V-fold PLP-dependent enzyme [Anaerolineae bacterium]|nr:aminotransferase class V-fold PLP-dependent enzyme [Anaerolineae bacterium]